MEDSRGATSTVVGPGSSHRPAATASGVDIESDHHHRQQQQQHVQPSPDHGSWLCCVPCYWLRRNNSVHKASLTVATLVVMSLLVASPVLFLISSVPAREGDRTRTCHRQVTHRNTVVCLAPVPVNSMSSALYFDFLDINTSEYSTKDLYSNKHNIKYNLTQEIRSKNVNILINTAMTLLWV